MSVQVAKTLIDYFPFPSIRENQKTVLEKIQNAIISGKKIIIVEAPTGFGKSPVAVAVCKYFGQSSICTATKDLQSQYTRDFPFLRLVKGRNNFECLDANATASAAFGVEIDDKVTAEDGMCVVDSGYDCKFKTRTDDYIVEPSDRMHPENEFIYLDDKVKANLQDEMACPYYEQKHIAFKASHSLFNYKYFLALVKSTNRNPEAKGMLKKKRLLILDECHNLEEELKDFHSVSISVFWIRSFIKDYKIKMPNIEQTLYTVNAWIPVLDDLRNRMIQHLEELKGDQNNVKTVRQIIKIGKYVEKLEELLFALQEAGSSNWIVSRIDRRDNLPLGEIVKVTFLPLSVARYTRDVFKFGDVVLMMSATILSKEAFCKMIGAAHDEVEFITVGSEFPKVNRPIYCLNIGQLNARTIDGMLPTIAKKCDEIMSRYPTVKGIIHTTSYKQLKYIIENISQDNKRRLLWTGEDIDREQVVLEHMSSPKPTVLISPSFHTGLDLKDDASRFQIIVKVPYPDLTDRWIKAKMEHDPQWYTWRTCLTLVQAYGRSVRSKTDYADTYILDSTFTGSFMNYATRILPQWFKEAIVR